MEKIIRVFEKTPLFSGLNHIQVEKALALMDGKIKNYDADEYVLMQGSKVNRIGIVIEGTLQIQRVDLFGRNTILTNLNQGNIFAETFVYSKVPESPVSVKSITKSKVMLLDFEKLLFSNNKNCIICSNINRNMLKILSTKNLILREKLDLSTLPTLRDKIMYFLSIEGEKQNSKYFSIDYDRNQLAEYLNVNRSALSRELSNMKKDGIIDYYKKTFKILD